MLEVVPIKGRRLVTWNLPDHGPEIWVRLRRDHTPPKRFFTQKNFLFCATGPEKNHAKNVPSDSRDPNEGMRNDDKDFHSKFAKTMDEKNHFGAFARQRAACPWVSPSFALLAAPFGPSAMVPPSHFPVLRLA